MARTAMFIGLLLPGVLLLVDCGNGGSDRIAAARALFEEGKQAEAREAATQLSFDPPRTVEGRLPLARLLIEVGVARRAVGILKDERLTPEARDVLAWAYLRAGDRVRARREVQAQVGAGTASGLTHRLRGELFLLELRPRDARAALTESLGRDPDDPMTYVLLAGAHMQEAERETAESVLRDAHRRFPSSAVVSGSLAEVVLSVPDPDTAARAEAVTLFRAAARRLPLEAGYAQGLAVNLYELGEFAEAERELVAITTRWPERAGEWNRLGLARLRLEKVEEAVAAFERAVSVGQMPSARRLECFLNLGNAQLVMADRGGDRGKWGRAAWRVFESARKLNPGDARVWVGLAKSTVETDPTGEKIRAAVTLYQKALAIDAGSFEANLNVALLFYELWIRDVERESEGKRRALFHFRAAEGVVSRGEWHPAARRTFAELEGK